MIGIINGIISALGKVLQTILLLLPDSPFIFVGNLDQQWLKYINYFLPVQEFVVVLEAYVIAVGIYYAIRIPLRWAKAAGE
ncbi:MAG: hypothetical protein N3I35_04755 [Clostridia bacterium]|nr:hypothetical protein [Clostridia bacterium]